MASARRVLYKPGDVIINNCKPLFKCLLTELRNKYCNNCFEKLEAIKGCNSCQLVNYCNKQCQVEDWKNGHKVECKLWKSEKLRDYFKHCVMPDYKMFLLRLYAWLKQKPEMVEQKFANHDGTLSCLSDEKNACLHKLAVCQDIEEFIMGMSTEVLIHRAAAISLVSLYVIPFLYISSEHHYGRIGMGIYIQTHMFTDSYSPNTVCVYNGIQLQIRSITRIKEGDKLQLNISKCNFDNLGFVSAHRRMNEQFGIDSYCNKWDKRSRDITIDLEKLNDLLNKMEWFQIVNILDKSDWRDVYVTHEAILGMFRNMYEEFDEHITNQLKIAFDIAVNLGIHKIQLNWLRYETREHIRITYGEEHVFYKDFQKFNRN